MLSVNTCLYKGVRGSHLRAETTPGTLDCLAPARWKVTYGTDRRAEEEEVEVEGGKVEQ